MKRESLFAQSTDRGGVGGELFQRGASWEIRIRLAAANGCPASGSDFQFQGELATAGPNEPEEFRPW